MRVTRINVEQGRANIIIILLIMLKGPWAVKEQLKGSYWPCSYYFVPSDSVGVVVVGVEVEAGGPVGS